MMRRARKGARAEGVETRAKNAASSAIRVLGSRAWGTNGNTGSFFVPAVPRSRRSRLVGREGARASPRERTSNISTTDMLVSLSMCRPSVTKVPSSSTSRVRSVPGASRASFARARASANSRASSRSRGPIAARAGVSTGRRRARATPGRRASVSRREGCASPRSPRCVRSRIRVRFASSLARFLLGGARSAGVDFSRFFPKGCPT